MAVISNRSGALAVSWLAMCAGLSLAQAPAANQIWDLQLATDCLDAPSIGITIRARVTITPNAAGTANFGVMRVGGASGSLLITVTDPNGATPTQGILTPGLTRELDALGQPRVEAPTQPPAPSPGPLAGLFHPFRGFLAPVGTGGVNGDPNNGVFSQTELGSLTLTSINCTRQGMWDDVPRGRGTIGPTGITGEYADVFRFVYSPQVREGVNWDPTITVTVHNLTARYIYARSGSGAAAMLTAAPAVAIPDRTFTFEVPAQPIVLRQPRGDRVCPGSTYTLDPRVAGLGPKQFQWFKDGSPVPGGTSQTLTLLSYTPAQAGTYRLLTTGACGSVLTDEAIITTEAAAPPVIAQHPVGGLICFDTPLTLVCEVEGAADLQWMRNGQVVTGATSPVLFLQGLDTEEGSYRMRATWPCGVVESDAAVLIVNQPPRITRQPASVQAAPGAEVVISADVTADETSVFRWHHNGAPMQDSSRISGTTTASLRIRSAAPTDGGDYRLTILDSCGPVVTTATARLTLLAAVIPGAGGLAPAAKIAALPSGADCPADLNHDGVADSEDFDQFIHMYFSGAAGADFNRDGRVNGDDLTAFIEALSWRCSS